MSILESAPLVDFAENLSITFQPILEIDWRGRRLHAVEALARGPAGTELEGADALFSHVRRRDQELPVDRLCVRAALAAVGRGSTIPNLCINVHAKTLAEDLSFAEVLFRQAAELEIAPSRLTIEVIEDGVNRRGQPFFRALDRLRAMGSRIAVDDVGSGASNLETVLECRPEYLKVSRYFIKGCPFDPLRRSTLEHLAQLAKTLGAELIAEGVECVGELDVVISLGIHLVQGFLFSAPASLGELGRTDLLSLERVPVLPVALR